MQVDTQPTAEASYARTLIERGCPALLAEAAAQVLARAESQDLSPEEQSLVARAYAYLTR